MALSIEEALSIIKVQSLHIAKELVCLEEAVGRVSAKEYRAKISLPLFNNSAMDGYAVKIEDTGKEVEVIETILAGEDKDITIKPGYAVKIMTGAKIPKGTEAIVPIEDVEISNQKIQLPQKIKEEANIRKRGEDICEGELLINKGELLNAYKIGLLASQGISYVEVYRKVRVAIFATGHELKMHYENLQESQIYNSNTPSLFTRCKELGCEVSFIGKSEDSLDAIKEAIKNALEADLIITSGGVSVGEADFTKEAFKEVGAQILFSKIDIKPGKPTTLAKQSNTYILNLPGNPLAAIVNFEIFGRTLINILSQRSDPFIQPITTKLKEELFLKGGRATVIPGTFDGNYFTPLQKRNPGMVKPASLMDGFIITDATHLKQESFVKFIPLFNLTSDKEVDFLTK